MNTQDIGNFHKEIECSSFNIQTLFSIQIAKLF